MPIYEYVPKSGDCDICGGKFEVRQSFKDPPLESCPTCAQPCQRLFSAFSVGGKGKSLMNPKNLEAKGFTQYVKKGKGYYEKTAGKGPQILGEGLTAGKSRKPKR